MTEKRRRGGQRKSYEDHAQKAARVLDAAVKLRQIRGVMNKDDDDASIKAHKAWRDEQARKLGFTDEAAALRFVRKPRRGTVAAILGDDVDALLGGTENRTQAALYLHLHHGVSLDLAARLLGKGGSPLDVRNLRRKASRLKRQRQAETDVQVTHPCQITTAI